MVHMMTPLLIANLVILIVFGLVLYTKLSKPKTEDKETAELKREVERL